MYPKTATARMNSAIMVLYLIKKVYRFKADCKEYNAQCYECNGKHHRKDYTPMAFT